MSFGRLEPERRDAPISDINVTPLVDVMLVLLVIFIITAPLMTSSLQLDLPQAPSAQPSEAPRSVTLALDAQGQLYLEDKPLSPTVMADRLRAVARQQPDTEIQLRADEQVPYGKVVELMGLAQQAGLNRIAFVAVPQR